jgi:hypothetical protein
LGGGRRRGYQRNLQGPAAAAPTTLRQQELLKRAKCWAAS